MFIEPCLPTISRTVPTGPKWAYEIKHDGFRFLAVRQGKRVRIHSRGGHDWSERLATITEALQALPVRSVVLDGEGVICGPDGKSDFDRMRACFSRQSQVRHPSGPPMDLANMRDDRSKATGQPRATFVWADNGFTVAPRQSWQAPVL